MASVEEILRFDFGNKASIARCDLAFRKMFSLLRGSYSMTEAIAITSSELMLVRPFEEGRALYRGSCVAPLGPRHEIIRVSGLQLHFETLITKKGSLSPRREGESEDHKSGEGLS